jgi:MFS family permease
LPKIVLTLNRDVVLLFTSRIVRMFAYGFLSVVLLLYLTSIGLSETQAGLLLTLTLVGDTAISLWMTGYADLYGRRRMMLVGAMLMIVAGAVFAFTNNFLLLLIAAAIGVISPSGNEVGPFLSIEQAALANTISDQKRTHFFAWYNLAGSFATAAGALASGALSQNLMSSGYNAIQSYRAVVLGYSILGGVLFLAFLQLTSNIEVRKDQSPAPTDLKSKFGLHRSKNVVLKLSALFSMDAFAGGFIMQSIIAYWFHIRFGVEPATLGTIFFFANILAGISALAAARLASKIGLIKTMVYTHIPSNVMLFLVPLMPSFSWAIGILLARFSISQMDVPTRQSYLMAVVEPDERSAAAGVTAIARSVGASLSPIITGPLLATPALIGLPFYIAGSLKIIYDLLLYRGFQSMKPPEEKSEIGNPKS